MDFMFLGNQMQNHHNGFSLHLVVMEMLSHAK